MSRTRTALLASLSLLASDALAQDLTRITGVPPAVATGSSRSVNWVDTDADGDLDLYVTNGGNLHENNEYYRNDGGGSFVPLAGVAVALDSLRADGSTWGDHDNDGHPDLFVVSWYGELNGLFDNDGSGGFTRVTTGPPVTTGTYSEGCAWVDYDADGDLDLYVANSGNGTPGSADNLLYRNDGGVFVSITGEPLVGENTTSRQPAWGDYDNDGDADVFVANEGGENNRLYRNQLVETGTAGFVEIDAGAPTNDGGDSWSASWGDFDNDGDLDLVVGNWSGENNFFYRNELVETGSATFLKITDQKPAMNRGWITGTTWADWDNDADLDLLFTQGSGVFPDARKRNFWYRNDGGVMNRENGSAAAADTAWSYGAAWGDHDDDGDLDLVVANWFDTGEANHFYRNEAHANGNHWLRVRCTGVTSNRSGIGCRVTAVAVVGGSPVTQIREIVGSDGYCSQTLEAHFGLGDATHVDTLTVRWPSGGTQTLTGVAADAVLEVVESTGTGVPAPSGAPEGVGLGAPRPNPFREQTEIAFSLETPAEVRVRVVDTAGRAVRHLLAGEIAGGHHRIGWDGRDGNGRRVAAGVYFVRVELPDGASAGRKVVRIR